ncbi:hypothetical protein JS87_21840 [Vibrio vulnificus]|uniref:hypothetical protein n=1 Tax=Vibrio vulnificus TaxID=672 RepID=UPI000501927E|nr:hypothetical protein [Vibrio vulnificus]KFK48402.1 hypothetical protein JS87_21840 [Vibrio vulnificus]HDY8229961.1 hypothetical protein [Vibrio vulnificus]
MRFKLHHMFWIMIILFCILTYFFFTYKYKEKEKLTGFVSYKNESLIYSPITGYISKLDNLNTKQSIMEITNIDEFNIADNGLTNYDITRGKFDVGISLMENNLKSENDAFKINLNLLKVQSVKIGNEISSIESLIIENRKIYNNEQNRIINDKKLSAKGLIPMIDIENREEKISSLLSNIINLELQHQNKNIEKDRVNQEISKIIIEHKNKINTFETELMNYRYDINLNNMNKIINIKPVSKGSFKIADLDIGSFVNKGDYLGKITDSDDKIFKIKIKKEQLGLLSIGDVVLAQISALSFSDYGFFEAKVIGIYNGNDTRSSLDITKVIELDIIKNTVNDENIKLINDGMQVDIYVMTNEITLFEMLFLPVIKTIRTDFGMSNL